MTLKGLCLIVLPLFWPFPSATTRKVYEKKLQKLLDQPAVEPEAPADITTLPKADSNQNGNTNSDQYSDKEDGELRVHIYRDHFFCFIMLSTINNSNVDNIVFFRGYCSS